MKRNVKNLIAAVCTAAAVTAAQSCSREGGGYYYYYPNAIVTVKPLAGENPSFYMQLDDSTTLVAENMETPPFGNKEVRALASIEETGRIVAGYDKSVHVYAIDSILTKNTVAYTDDETADSLYGTDPVEMVNNWMTVVEDGYITLRVRVAVGGYGAVHRLTLMTGVNPEDPYEVEFRHRIEDGQSTAMGPDPLFGDALVAFRLDSLPDTQGETVKLTLRWRSFYEGEKTVQFDYCTRKSSPEKMKIGSGTSFLTNVR